MRPHYQISKFVSLRGALVHGTSFLLSSKAISRKEPQRHTRSKIRKARKARRPLYIKKTST